MPVADSGTGAAGQRLVWTGRLEGVWAGGIDGWSHTRQQIVAALGMATELVVLDCPSFPWGAWHGARRDIPVIARLPEELGAEQIAELLGGPLLTQITPHDRLVEARADVRAELTDRFDLPDVWVVLDGDPQPIERVPGWAASLAEHLENEAPALAAARESKPRFNQMIQVISDDLRDRLAPVGGDEARDAGRSGIRPLVAVAGSRQFRPQLFASPIDALCRRLESFDDEDPAAWLPSPDAVIAILDDGGQSAEERIALLRTAHRSLQPGGVLLVAGHVVTRADGQENPGIAQLVEELDAASGCGLQLEELRSVRWAGESQARGVVLRYSSLQLQEI